MTPNDFNAFRDGLSGVYGFYGKDVTGFVLDVWWNALKGYDLTTVTEAFGRHLMNPDNGQFLPKPADIVRLVEGTTQDAACLAWAKVQRAVGSVGQYQSIVFDDPVIHAVIDAMGGWPALCQTSEDELPFLAKRFEQNYRAAKARGNGLPVYPRYLCGVSEMQNAQSGFRSDPPRLVGDLERAKQVFFGGTEMPRLPVHGGEAVVQALRLVGKKHA